MLLNQLRNVRPYITLGSANDSKRYNLYNNGKLLSQCIKTQAATLHPKEQPNPSHTSLDFTEKNPIVTSEIFHAERVVSPMVLTDNKDHIVLPFDDVPGPKTLKYISSCRHYLSNVGTQITASIITMGLNIGTYLNTRKPLKNLSALFDEYGPVVRFVSPVGGDIVLINHPEHIQKVYSIEGEYPVRSNLDSLEKYRAEHRNCTFGPFTIQGQGWSRQRSVVLNPLNSTLEHHLMGLEAVCKRFSNKVYNIRNYQDELSKDLYRELHKWAFDCMGLILFSKKFKMVDTELVYSQCDMSWLYHSLDKATEAIIKCESGLHFWKFFPTPAWAALVKYCDSLDGLIGKYVMETEQNIANQSNAMDFSSSDISLVSAMLTSSEKISPEDIATITMDMLLIGVNTVTSSMSFLLYHLAKYHKAQMTLYKEIADIKPDMSADDLKKLIVRTPYLQACIKETLRLVPPIPVLTRILPKNITLDRYNIPRGTLIIMSTQDAGLKESNFEDASVFNPERWLKDDVKDYHAFASIPFGSGVRKCLAQNIAETMMTLLTVTVLQKYKLEYHYGDVQSTRSFISRPNKALKIRFVDRQTI